MDRLGHQEHRRSYTWMSQRTPGTPALQWPTASTDHGKGKTGTPGTPAIIHLDEEERTGNASFTMATGLNRSWKGKDRDTRNTNDHRKDKAYISDPII